MKGHSDLDLRADAVLLWCPPAEVRFDRATLAAWLASPQGAPTRDGAGFQTVGSKVELLVPPYGAGPMNPHVLAHLRAQLA